MFGFATNTSNNAREKRKRLEEQAKKDLLSGNQRRITVGTANAGSGKFNFMATTGNSAPSISAPANYTFGNVGSNATVNIGSISHSNNATTTATTNTTVHEGSGAIDLTESPPMKKKRVRLAPSEAKVLQDARVNKI
jgi:hypothetical protein